MWRKITHHPFAIRLLNWEYWPVYISNIPVFFYWIIFAIRARDPMFFSAVNPAIPTGGMFGEEKHRIYDLIPGHFLPATHYLPPADDRAGQIHKLLSDHRLSFPLVCKPDIGERGMHVKVVHNTGELIAHTQKMHGGIIIQEYIPYPLELSVMCYRDPHHGGGAVTSVCRKHFLSVHGDGHSTLSELIDRLPRAILQKSTLARRMDLSIVPGEGEEMLLEGIGNHCRGTQFLNANAWISPALERTILDILREMRGVYYGRFDLRTTSIGALEEGREFLIMEFNGTGSEPAHIYDPDYPVWNAYRDIWHHWRIMYRIARAQKRNGVTTMSLGHALASFRTYVQYKRQAQLVFSQ